MENTSVFVGEKLLEAESKGALFDVEVDSVRLWQYVRYSCLAKILEEITGVETACRDVSVVRDYEKKRDLQEWFKHQQFLVHKKDILVLNHPRRVREGKYYKCFVTDRILENLDYSYCVYERDYYGLHYKPARTKHLKYVDVSIIRKTVKYDEERVKKQLSDFVRKIVCTFEDYCSIVISKSLRQYICSYVFSAYRDLYYNRIWARIVLKLVRPRLVMVTVGYSSFVQAMITEAKCLHIPTIELQHARIGRTHLAYNYIYKGNIESFADYIFVYGSYDKVVARYPIAADHVIAVGYPELEQKARYYAKNKRRSKREVITFLSAPGPGDTVLKYALELRKNENLKDYRIIYKLHPCEYRDWKKWYPQLENSGLEIVSDNQHDIYYYLGHSDYVVGISSTVLFEAIEFDTQIFIIKDGDYRKAEYLYQNNYACLVESIEQLIDKLGTGKREKRIDEENKYFKQDSIFNIQNNIAKIMKRKTD